MMTTDYVHPVADGDITTLRQFALRCSYAMMALVTLRDEDHTKDPPRRLEPNFVYYDEQLKEAQARLDQLARETSAEREARVEAEYQERLASAREFDAKDKIEVDRVRAMLTKVEAWDGGPEGLKDFMLQQLRNSISDSGYRAVDYVKRLDPDVEWRNAVDAVGRAHANIEREKALTASRNQWLDQLWAALLDEETV